MTRDEEAEIQLVVKALEGRFFETERGTSPLTKAGAFDVGMALRRAGLQTIEKGQ